MAKLPETPTITALVMIGLTTITIFVVVGRMFYEYSKRQRPAALLIAAAYASWGLAALATFIGALLHYILVPEKIAGVIQYARYGYNTSYAFSAISNIFIVYFVSEIFSRYPLFRQTNKLIPILHSIANGVTIGFIINSFIQSSEANATDITELYNPAYPLSQNIYHLILTFFSLILLFVYSARSRRQAELRWEEAGFGFIMGSAIFGILIYAAFVIDLLVSTYLSDIFGLGYTVFINLGWFFAIVMIILAYIGFFMPERIRNRYRIKEGIS